MHTNIGRVLTARGGKLLVSFKDPIASFQDFYELSVENPEVACSSSFFMQNLTNDGIVEI